MIDYPPGTDPVVLPRSTFDSLMRIVVVSCQRSGGTMRITKGEYNEALAAQGARPGMAADFAVRPDGDDAMLVSIVPRGARA